MWQFKYFNFPEIKYYTKESFTYEDAIKEVLGNRSEYFDLNEPDQCLDALYEAFHITFKAYHAKQVRTETTRIRNKFIKEVGITYCDRCGKELIGKECEFHHKTSVALYGGNEEDNLQIVCESCHKILDNEK